jgi:antirestriction protein ArdC
MFSSSNTSERFDVHRALTARIVEAIEAGAGDFAMPWHISGPSVGRPINAYSGVAYRGVNVVALWAEAVLSGYPSGAWASYRQWAKLGAQVRQGERGATIVFYKPRERREDEVEGEDTGQQLIARASRVFNADPVAGWTAGEPPPGSGAADVIAVEAFVQATDAKVRHSGQVACYRPREDVIEMPDRTRFVASEAGSATEAYYAVLLHELTHWSGAAHRLGRNFGERFGDSAYAFEELVAELGAAFLCADLAVSNTPRPDHAGYVSGWLKVLKDDRKAIFLAARLANQAAQYLQDLAQRQGS